MFKRQLMILSVAMLLVTGAWQGVSAQDEMIAVKESLAEALNAHDMDLFASYLAEDAVWDYVPLPAPMNVESMKGFFGLVFQAYPDFGSAPGLALVADNILVEEHVAQGTHQGEWLGVPASGQTVLTPHIDIMEFEGDKVAKLTSYVDVVGGMVQMGAMPAFDFSVLQPSFALPDPEPTGLAPADALRDFVARFNSHDMANLTKMIRPDADLAANGVPMSLATYMGANELIYLAAHSDLRLEIVRVLDMGEGWVAGEFMVTGTDDGGHELLGMPKTGLPINLRLASLGHYDAEGMVTYLHFYYDQMTELLQLGLVAPPGTVVSRASWGEIKAKHRE